jgi:hypothetical protein
MLLSEVQKQNSTISAQRERPGPSDTHAPAEPACGAAR